MIEGIKVQLSSQELRDHLEKRAAHHREKVDFCAGQVAALLVPPALARRSLVSAPMDTKDVVRMCKSIPSLKTSAESAPAWTTVS
jgi:hypothetical protein